MHFNQYGKTFQLRIETAADLEAILALDESHWVATSAPTEVFRCDPHFISLLDPDGSGRIHTNEMKDAIGWFLKVISDRSKLRERTNHVPLSAINTASPEGKEILTSAKYVLNTLDREEPYCAVWARPLSQARARRSGRWRSASRSEIAA